MTGSILYPRIIDSEAEATQVNNPKTGRQMKVRLTEIGPRMNIRLVKIEDGLCGGQGPVQYNRMFMYLSIKVHVHIYMCKHPIYIILQ